MVVTISTPGLAADPPQWMSNNAYKINDLVTFSSIVYQCRQAHTSQVGWEPPKTYSLWMRPTPTGVSEWTVQTNYLVGSQVLFNGQPYKCLQAHVSQPDWAPNVTGTLWLQLPFNPTLKCVADLGNSHFAAVFGYRNDSSAPMAVPVGSKNQFNATPFRGQPTVFNPGQHPNAFGVEFDLGQSVVWTLNGVAVTASSASSRCILQCPANLGRTADGQCVELEPSDRILKQEDVPDVGPSFSTQAAAEAYILERVPRYNLGHVANPVGHSTGLQGFRVSSGEVFIPRDDGTIETFDDKFSVVLGGRNRTITVAAQQLCLDEKGCSTVGDPDFCDPRNDFCIGTSSFIYDFPPLLSFYHSVGGETGQGKGGYQESSHWCRKWGFIPWRCSSKSGTNNLNVQSSFVNHQGISIGQIHAQGHDTSNVKAKLWSIFLGGKIEVDANFSSAGGDFEIAPGCMGAETFDCTVEGVCSNHSGSGSATSRTASDRFASGSTANSCEAGGIP